MDRREKIKNLPDSPGVYLMKDENGQTIYVGKAKNLKRRVSSYFHPARRLPERLLVLVRKVKDISFIPTTTEAEALIYENGLIKRLSPKYNVALKDDKSYPMLKLTANERYPRLFIARQKKEDGAIYYGPYSDAKLLREALDILRWLFPMRTCNKMPKRVCLNYHIKQCPGPCAGKGREIDYAGTVAELKLFLDGKKAELLGMLGEKMAEAAKKEDFEKAAELKNKIETLGSMKAKSVAYGPMKDAEELRAILGIDKPLEVIEAFDVSNIMGDEAVGSMIYFHKGKPKKSQYRKFRIRTVSKIDDYAMMRELVNRRYSRLLEEKGRLPDLVLIDGGKGHLNAVLDELKKLSITSVPAIGIAKEFEHIYVGDRGEPIVLPKESKALHILERIRDEAHRFAVSYHKKLLSKKVEVSELDGIAGIGPKRKKALMSFFGSVENLRRAGLEELLKVEGVDEKTARNIIGYFTK